MKRDIICKLSAYKHKYFVYEINADGFDMLDALWGSYFRIVGTENNDIEKQFENSTQLRTQIDSVSPDGGWITLRIGINEVTLGNGQEDAAIFNFHVLAYTRKI